MIFVCRADWAAVKKEERKKKLFGSKKSFSSFSSLPFKVTRLSSLQPTLFKPTLGFFSTDYRRHFHSCTLLFSFLVDLDPSVSGFNGWLPSFPGLNWVFLGFTQFYWVFTRLHWVLQGFTCFFLGFTGFYSILLGFHEAPLSFIGFYWVLLSFPEFYLVFTGLHWVLLGFTEFYWVLTRLRWV